MFSTVQFDQSDLAPLLQKLSKEIRNRIIQKIKITHLDNLERDRSWQSDIEARYKTWYQVSAEIINGIAKNLRVYGKFAGLWTSSGSASSA